MQSSILRQFAQNGWIDTSALAAAMLMVAVLSTLLLPIVAAVISSLPSLRASAMFPARKAYIVASCFAVGLSFATLMLANQIQPLVVDRYLMAYLPFAIAPLTAVAAPVFATNRYFAIGVITLVVGQIALASTTVASEDRWNATARLVEDARDSCPRSPVIAVPYWRFFSGYQVGPNEPEAWRIGMDQTARRFGISFRDASSARWQTHSSCPTILWVEHFYKLPPPAAAVMAAAGLTVSPGLAERAVTRRGDTGFIIILPAH